MSTTAKPREPGRVPKFQSYEEEAEFWDRHSPEEFPDEFEEVQVEFARAGGRELTPENRRKLVSALSTVDSSERQALALVLLGLGPSEIARVMGWSSEECRRALREARKRIATFSLDQ